MTPSSHSILDAFTVYGRKIERKLTGKISLRTRQRRRGAVLLSYVTHPFILSERELERSPHTNPWECLEIATILLNRGFDVDVIDWTSATFVPRKRYAMVIDVAQNLERFSHVLPEECVKIFYITGAYWQYQNEAEKKRLAELQERRGCALAPRRQMEPSRNIENSDYATALGNSFAKGTYAFADKPIAQIPLFSTALFPSPKDKPFAQIKKHFVWIGGGGAVHKGLDRVLECFASLPDYRLTICGPVQAEEDFMRCYQKELVEMQNIRLVGRIDIRGTEFREIILDSVGLVYPSCSEGQSGSVLTGLHAGLIPILTHESGVDVEPFGIRLATASVDDIREAVTRIGNLPDEELRRCAVAAWQYARTKHTIEAFREKYSTFIDTIIQERSL